MDDLFTHEDLSKPENRINVSMFGLLSADIFRTWLHSRLGLDPNAVIYPSKNVVKDASGIRPDFVIRHAHTNVILGWIEIECGRDEEQLARFRSRLPERVFAIWGRTVAGADLGLDEIAAFIESADATSHHPQVRHNLRHLRELIVEALDGPASISYKVAAVSEATLQTPFVRALRAALGDRMMLDLSTPIRRGEIRAQTYAEKGFSLRVYSNKATSKSVSILSQSGGRPEVVFQSKAKLDEYLPRGGAAVARLAALVGQLGGDMVGIARDGKTAVSIGKATERAAELAEAICELAAAEG